MHFNFKPWLMALTMLFSVSAFAADYSEGNGYQLLPEPLAVMADGKIHVEEAFWYGCPHCYSLEGSVTRWSKNLPADVEFSGLPAMFGRAWVAHAQFYFVADALGVLDQVHDQIFRAIHVQKEQLLSQKDQRNFLVERAKVDPDAFGKMYNSFTVKSRMKQANQRVLASKIDGVPAMIVQGKYLVNSSTANGQDNILKVVDFLIEKERKALKN
ncbi:MAG: thiol:disulfide interchange protein DsbA/DsbL [Venatoribacter sp.]